MAPKGAKAVNIGEFYEMTQRLSKTSTTVSLDVRAPMWLKLELRQKAAALGLNLSEYVRYFALANRRQERELKQDAALADMTVSEYIKHRLLK